MHLTEKCFTLASNSSIKDEHSSSSFCMGVVKWIVLCGVFTVAMDGLNMTSFAHQWRKPAVGGEALFPMFPSFVLLFLIPDRQESILLHSAHSQPPNATILYTVLAFKHVLILKNFLPLPSHPLEFLTNAQIHLPIIFIIILITQRDIFIMGTPLQRQAYTANCPLSFTTLLMSQQKCRTQPCQLST